MNGQYTLYSIGHGHKTQKEFTDELRSFGIKFLIDVRSTPYSKWAPHFNQKTMNFWLNDAGIKYCYMGDVIGGKPQDASCYDEDGFFDYKKMAQMPNFRAGLQRLLTAYDKHLMVAIMCSESDPSQCHRSKLIGRELYFGSKINMLHITDLAHPPMSQTKIMEMLTEQCWSPNEMFPAEPYFKSRKAYKNTEIESENKYDDIYNRSLQLHRGSVF